MTSVKAQAQNSKTKMLCKIADLLVEVPEEDGMSPRIQDYKTTQTKSADIIIRANCYETSHYPQNTTNEFVAYMESARQFYRELRRFGGLMLHASAVELDGKAYLFSAPCGTGKSTHTRLWQQVFGERAHVFNDDKPALRLIDGKWYAYGTPWCGKDGININMKAELAGICFLKQAPQNKIRRLDQKQAISNILWQTMNRFKKVEMMELAFSHVENLVTTIPVYEFENLPIPESAELSYNTMRNGAKEMGL